MNITMFHLFFFALTCSSLLEQTNNVKNQTMLHAKVTKCVCLDINKTIFFLSCCSFDIGIESNRSFSEGLDRKARKKIHTHDLRPFTGMSIFFCSFFNNHVCHVQGLGATRCRALQNKNQSL